MKYLLKGILLVLVIAFLRTPIVHAGDYISDAIEALKTSNVYVAPGTPGTDSNTASNLKKFLANHDNIVLVMLPAEALDGTDTYSIAKSISAGLDDQKTIGLAIGRDVIGYSVVLSPGIAEDKMSRANSVSNDPITALITFTQNIHSWQSKNPQPSPTPLPTPIPTPRPTPAPLKLPKVNEIPWLAKVTFLIILLALFGTLLVLIRRAVRNSSGK